MSKQYTEQEVQRIREIFKQLETSFNSWGPLLEELFEIYGDYTDQHVTILQSILRIMTELNYVEATRGAEKERKE